MSGGFTAIAHGFPEHPKIADLHDRAFRFHVTALDYCSRNLTDGHVSTRAVKVIAAILNTTPKRWPSELVAAGLWVEDKGEDGYWINDYLVYNPSAAAMRTLSDKRRQAGIRGAEKRWRGGADPTPESLSKSDGKGHGKEQIPAVAVSEQKEPDSTTGTSSYEAMESLPFENEFLTLRLLELVKRDADEGTETVLRAYAAKVAPAAISRVIENVTKPQVRNRASYAVRSLKAEATEAEAA